MDGQRLDDLTRRMATGTSRRQVLRLGGRGLVAGLLTRAGMRGVAADDTPKPLGKKCNKSAQCASGFCHPETGTCDPGTIVPGELTSTDPVISAGCAGGRHYDAYTFEHPGGPLSLSVRGAASGGGTLPDPYLVLFTGGVPSDFCGDARIAADDDSGCGFDAYLELADLAAGTYTAVVFEFSNRLGTYTFERNTFTGGACPA